jgi:predicted ATPase/transcriptional regulator with XRE-family HTH domain
MSEEWENFVSFGYWVQRRRKALDLTQAKLAQQIGCSPATIKKIEQDGRRPSLQMAELLADHLLIGEADRERFLQLARGKFVPAMPSPLGVVALPPFLQSQEISSSAADSPFVAREEVLAGLGAMLELVRAGTGQIIFVIGGAGRGKTMLVQEFARRAQADNPDLLVASGYCNAHTGVGDPYLPFREVLTLLTGDVQARWAGGLISRQQAGRLWQAMSVTIPALVEQAPDLLDTFVPGQALQTRAATFAPPEATWYSRLSRVTSNGHAELKQEHIFTQYTAVLKTIAARQPLLLIIEDLHWVDPSSSSLLFHLSRHMDNSPILIIGTYRPDEMALNRGSERHPLADVVGELKRQRGDIWLDLAGVTDGRDFVDAFLDIQPNRLPESFRHGLFAHTGGHPLFTVELLRDMQERGDLEQDNEGHWIEGTRIDWQTTPAKVEGVIEQRISRLENELQTVLTIASVEGEFFTAEVIARAQNFSERRLVQRLSHELDKQHRLVTAVALERLGRQRLSLYRFRHQLFQHYLYHSLDETERAYLHEEVGAALEALYGDETNRIAVQLARHFEEAGFTEKAVKYLLQSGQLAMWQSANEEAIHHFERGLALLESLPDTPARAQQEFELQMALSGPLLAVKGYGALETVQAVNRAAALAEQIGDASRVFPLLYSKMIAHFIWADHQAANATAHQFLSLALQQPDSGPRMMGHRIVGLSTLAIGELESSLAHLEQALACYDPQQHPALAFQYGQEPGMAALCIKGWVLWLLGYPDQALASSEAALRLARTAGETHLYSLAYGLVWIATLHQFRRELPSVQDLAQENCTLCETQNFQYPLAKAQCHHGWALVGQGQVQEGVEQIQQGLARLQSTQGRWESSYFMGLLAEVYAKAGQPQEGLDVLAEAMAMVAETAEHFWEAELVRLKGELLLRQDNKAAAEVCYRQAIDVARGQQAKSLELRATVSLSRLWQREGKSAEAFQMLSAIYNWFTEGVDTLDLIEAGKLLEELKRANYLLEFGKF